MTSFMYTTSENIPVVYVRFIYLNSATATRMQSELALSLKLVWDRKICSILTNKFSNATVPAFIVISISSIWNVTTAYNLITTKYQPILNREINK